MLAQLVIFVLTAGRHMGNHLRIPDLKTAAAALAMVEIVGFPRQTASTTRFEIQSATNSMYVKTNYQTIYATDSGASLKQNFVRC